jgi:hypothetical protein
MSLWSVIVSSVVLLTPVMSGVPQSTPTPAQTPKAFYLSLVVATKKATAPEQVIPLMTSEFGTALSRNKAMATEWLKGMKSTLDLGDITFTKETIAGDKCELEATAKTGAGKPATGRIQLVKEKGQWRLDDHGWVSPI